MLATFLDQPGIPLVRVEPLGGNRVRLSQRRFLNSGVTAPAATPVEPAPAAEKAPDAAADKTSTQSAEAVKTEAVVMEEATKPTPPTANGTDKPVTV